MSASSCDRAGAAGRRPERDALKVAVSVAELAARRCEALVNRLIGESTPARRAAQALDGRSMTVEVAGLGLELNCAVAGGVLAIALHGGREADVRLRATPLELLRLARAASPEELRRTRARLDGDVHVAEGFAELARFARPDVEDELARWIGDIAAHETAEAGRRFAAFAARARRALALDAAEYLQEEQRLLPGPLEVDAFSADVERLRDGVERAEARLKRLEAAAGSRR